MTSMPTVKGSRQQSVSLAAITIDASGISDGDWMTVELVHNGSTLTYTPPAGWVKIVDENYVATVPENPYYATRLGTRGYSLWGRIKGRNADGTPDSADLAATAYTFTLSAANTQRIVLVWGGGVRRVADWTLGVPRKRAGTTAEQYLTIANSVTTVEANCLVLVFNAEATSSADAAAPTVSGATRIIYAAQGTGANTSVIEQATVDSIAKVVAGATGEVSTTWNQLQPTNGAAVMLVLPPVPAEDPVGVGYPVQRKTAEGVFTEQRVYVKKAEGLRSPTDIKFVKPGVKTVTELLAKPAFVVAHRLGSKNWPEHSLHGATQSLLRGVDALEFSVGRSSDGVYFGLHDADINRTSGLAAGTLPAANLMTWAEISAYQILASITDDPTQPNRPYLKFDDIMASYPSVVFFLDPKYLGQAGAIAFFTQLKATYPDALERFMLKYSWTATNLWNPIGTAGLGFRGWGYLYESDLALGNFDTLAAAWTILGLDYNTSDAGWTTFKTKMDAIGKKYTGHIAPTLAAAQKPLSYGAIGNMVSGVKQVKGF